MQHGPFYQLDTTPHREGVKDSSQLLARPCLPPVRATLPSSAASGAPSLSAVLAQVPLLLLCELRRTA